jgi:replicative DNA helicase
MHHVLTVNAAQKMVLSAAFHSGPEVFDHVPPDSLADPFRQIALALAAMHARHEPITLVSLTTECARRGFAPHIERWMMGPVTSEAATREWLAASSRERLMQTITRAQQMLDSSDDVDHYAIASDMRLVLDGIETPDITTDDPAYSYEEVLGLAEKPVEWVIPDLLARRERMVLTGTEGRGKSMLVYQIAFCAAYGVSPVDPRSRFDRRRVVILDVENSHETQVVNLYKILHTRMHRLVTDHTPPDIHLLRQREIDLTSPVHRAGLIANLDVLQPDLVILGSGYKLIDATADYRVMAVTLQGALDTIKNRYGCAVIMETHAGHGFDNDRNGMRPDGSSYWLRWPEFGHGVAEVSRDRPDVLKNHRWRNDRPVGRTWPAGWERDEYGLPWRAVQPDEWDALDLEPDDHNVTPRRR